MRIACNAAPPRWRRAIGSAPPLLSRRRPERAGLYWSQHHAPLLLSAAALWLLRNRATRKGRSSPHCAGRGRLADAGSGGTRKPVHAYRAARRYPARGALHVQKPAVRFLPAAGLAIRLHAVLGTARDPLGS